MRKLWILAVMICFSGWSRAGESTRARVQQPTAAAGFLTAIPTPLTGASCSGPGGTATLTMASNPFTVGQWIAVRDVPLSAAIVVASEKVATGDGATKTFTFQVQNYPIKRGSVTILVAGARQAVDEPGMPYPNIGVLRGSGVESFRGTVTISDGKTVTLTSSPAVFDARWRGFMPTIAGKRGHYIVAHGIDSTHLKLMSPGIDGAGQSFDLASQVDYFPGLVEVTFTSAPGAGVPITISYTGESSQWHGERKVESATPQSVSYAEPNCTSAGAKVSGGVAFAIPVMYVAPASHTNCAYDGDGGQACTPSDANAGATKARPKATLNGVQQALNRHVLTIPYMIQLADADGTGLGGSTPETDCYQPNMVTITGLTMGGSPVDENELLQVDEFPQSYFWFHGNSRNPGNVLFNGSGTCTKSSRGVATPEALRFDRTVARVDGFSVQGYGNLMRPGMAPSAITFGNFATGYVENMVCTGAQELNPRYFTLCIGAWDHSSLKLGGNHTVRNANWVHAVNGSNLFTSDPADSPTQNTNLDYSSDTERFVIGCSIMSNCQIDRLTAVFTGSGDYTVLLATEKAALYYAERYGGSQCPNSACMDLTVNAPNMTWEAVGLGGKIDGPTCGDHQQGTCTIIAGPKVRAYAQEDAFVKEYGQSKMKAPDIALAGGCVEVWAGGPSLPPICAAMAFKSENKSFVPLTLQNASGSSSNILDMKTGEGALAASFNAAGQISKINSVATAGNGVGAEVYSTVSDATNASLPPTTMLTPGADGGFAVHFYLTQVDRGEGCTAAARVAVNLIYTDPFSEGAQPYTFVVPLNSGGSEPASRSLSLSTGTISVANAAIGSLVIRARGGSPIQYSTTYTNGACTTQPSYRVAPVLIWF